MSFRKLAWPSMAVAIGVIVLVVWWQGRAAPAPEPAEVPAHTVTVTGSQLHLEGTSSCSARACHGGIEPLSPRPKKQTVLQNEFTLWVRQDKHANAFQVLRSEDSEKIRKNLGLEKPAYQEERCLACHTNPMAVNIKDSDGPAARLMRDERTFGVGCESCHGPASKWLDPHTQHGWAKNLKPEEREKLGWQPMNDLETRVRACVGCHIGAPAANGLPRRDMNHDLIAAGHPRLHFEFATFLANLPPHWNKEARQPKPADEAHTWAIGQLVSAQAALELLVDRTTGGKDRPWPEFAEYDCFACHHGLREPSWRQRRGYAGRTPGALPYGTWYLSMPRGMAAQKAAGGAKLLDDLTKEMGLPYPRPAGVRETAKAVAKELGDWRKELAQKKYDPRSLGNLLRLLAADNQQVIELTWDSAEQLYLAAAAWRFAQQDEGFFKRNEELNKLRAFPPGFNSPAAFEPGEFRKRLGESLQGRQE